ncbi:hypothetical protein NKH77_46555 [Streptomyces sp. M19]
MREESGSTALTARWTWPRALLSDTEATALADDWAEAVGLLAACSDQAEAPRPTPADCPSYASTSSGWTGSRTPTPA